MSGAEVQHFGDDASGLIKRGARKFNESEERMTSVVLITRLLCTGVDRANAMLAVRVSRTGVRFRRRRAATAIRHSHVQKVFFDCRARGPLTTRTLNQLRLKHFEVSDARGAQGFSRFALWLRCQLILFGQGMFDDILFCAKIACLGLFHLIFRDRIIPLPFSMLFNACIPAR